jgi:hypothetical protein
VTVRLEAPPREAPEAVLRALADLPGVSRVSLDLI